MLKFVITVQSFSGMSVKAKHRPVFLNIVCKFVSIKANTRNRLLLVYAVRGLFVSPHLCTLCPITHMLLICFAHLLNAGKSDLSALWHRLLNFSSTVVYIHLMYGTHLPPSKRYSSYLCSANCAQQNYKSSLNA